VSATTTVYDDPQATNFSGKGSVAEPPPDGTQSFICNLKPNTKKGQVAMKVAFWDSWGGHEFELRNLDRGFLCMTTQKMQCVKSPAEKYPRINIFVPIPFYAFLKSNPDEYDAGTTVSKEGGLGLQVTGKGGHIAGQLHTTRRLSMRGFGR